MPFITQGKTNWKFLLIFIVLSVMFCGVVIYFQYKLEGSIVPYSSSENLKPKIKTESCSYYGTLDKDFYLNKYIAQEGDTLLSISQKELGDSSRIDELIEINKAWHPNLSIENPYIEVGWELRIPPKFFPKSSGFLLGYGGKVLSNSESEIIVNLSAIKEVGTVGYKNSQTQYLGSSNFKQGDCVYIIKDFSGRAEAGILAISPQDKNYFKEQQPEFGNSSSTGGNCPFYGYLDADFYLVRYTVQKGESIYSIVQNKLGDTSRVDEVINLNHRWYPHLSIENPFIEIGWEIRLPSVLLPSSSGFLVGYGGEVLSETNGYRSRFSISLTKDIPEEWKGPNIEYGLTVFKNPRTKYFGQSDFKTGDCMYAIVDTGEKENYAIAISHQDKNYFK